MQYRYYCIFIIPWFCLFGKKVSHRIWNNYYIFAKIANRIDLRGRVLDKSSFLWYNILKEEAFALMAGSPNRSPCALASPASLIILKTL
jgi:hypothetical protein